MKKAKIYYIHPCDIRATRDEKIAYIEEHKFQDIPFEHIQPDKNNNWIDLTDNDFEDLMVLSSKNEKVNSLFSLSSNTIKTNRDSWVYDFSKEKLNIRIKSFIDIYNIDVDKYHHNKSIPDINDKLNYNIKWSRDLKNELLRNRKVSYNQKKIRQSLFRPFIKKYFYADYILNDVLTTKHYSIYGSDLNDNNLIINFSDANTTKPFHILATNSISDYHFLSDTQCLPLYRYDSEGNKHDNITGWGLEQFQNHYKNREITKEDIFYYTYGVLHDPNYRKKYELNLKREFPRLPFYDDFWQWRDWGKELMDLHIGFEQAEKFPLQVVNNDFDKPRTPLAKLRADKENGIIILDEKTSLLRIPVEVWEYKLGNRSALEWILDQYKEKKPRDPTIREKFNTYRFADYKEKVIDLLMRVCTVSVETVRIVKKMEKIKS